MLYDNIIPSSNPQVIERIVIDRIKEDNNNIYKYVISYYNSKEPDMVQSEPVVFSKTMLTYLKKLSNTDFEENELILISLKEVLKFLNSKIDDKINQLEQK